MIISMHTPKAGGSSFRAILKKYYGWSLKEDYSDIPINKSFEERTQDAITFNEKMNRLKRVRYKLREVKCIHGHFLPYKYKKFLEDDTTVFITWLRDPAERVISHYYYWKRAYRKNSAPLHKKVIEESWSLEKFCLSDEMKNIYAKFLWGFAIENFDFIGITENFEEDVSFFIENYLHSSKTYKIPKKNINPNIQGSYSEKMDQKLLSEIKSFHSEDYNIYKYAIAKRKKRMRSISEKNENSHVSNT